MNSPENNGNQPEDQQPPIWQPVDVVEGIVIPPEPGVIPPEPGDTPEDIPQQDTSNPESQDQSARRERAARRMGRVVSAKWQARKEARADAKKEQSERKQKLADHAAGMIMQHHAKPGFGIPENPNPAPENLTKHEAKQLRKVQSRMTSQGTLAPYKGKDKHRTWRTKVVGETGHYSAKETREHRKAVKRQAIADQAAGLITPSQAQERIQRAKHTTIRSAHHAHALKAKNAPEESTAAKYAKKKLVPKKGSLNIPDAAVEMDKPHERYDEAVVAALNYQEASPHFFHDVLGIPLSQGRAIIRQMARDGLITPHEHDFDSGKVAKVDHIPRQVHLQQQERPSVDDRHPMFDEVRDLVANTQYASPAHFQYYLGINPSEGRGIMRQLQAAGYIKPNPGGASFQPIVLLPRPERQGRRDESASERNLKLVASLDDDRKRRLKQLDNAVLEAIVDDKNSSSAWEGLTPEQTKAREQQIRNLVYNEDEWSRTVIKRPKKDEPGVEEVDSQRTLEVIKTLDGLSRQQAR